MNDIDYGPLSGLIGTWSGDSGLDVAPEPDSTENNPYYETIVFEAGGDVTNAERQTLAIVPYTQIVKRKSNDEVFHHQMGYWLYDANTGEVMQSLVIPRGVAVLASGIAKQSDGAIVIEISDDGKDGTSSGGIVQSSFMQHNASTVGYRQTLTIDGDSLTYRQITSLDIYSKKFTHSDENTLVRVG